MAIGLLSGVRAVGFSRFSMRLPPHDVSQRELFASLLPLRPSVAVAGLPGLPPLRMQALGARALERIAAGEDCDIALVVAALGTTPEAIGALYLPEVRELARQARAVIRRFPVYGLSDIDAWTTALAAGARGTIEGYALGSCCVDDGVERPDRFWGAPLGELLDCHWFAFRGALRAYPKDPKK